MTTLAEKIAVANEDANVDPHWVTVLYADYGKRKTTTACRMVKDKGLLLSTDDSWKTLLGTKFASLLAKLKIVSLRGLSQLDYVDMKGYDTIIWDTASKSVDRYLDLLSSRADWGGKYRDKINSTHPELRGAESLGLPDYKFTRDQFRPVLDKLFNETQANIVFTSQMTTPIPGMGTNQSRRPKIPDATFSIIGERADIIGQLKPGNRNSFVIDVTENSASALGKSRIESIQGSMDVDDFVTKYKEFCF